MGYYDENGNYVGDAGADATDTAENPTPDTRDYAAEQAAIDDANRAIQQSAPPPEIQPSLAELYGNTLPISKESAAQTETLYIAPPTQEEADARIEYVKEAARYQDEQNALRNLDSYVNPGVGDSSYGVTGGNIGPSVPPTVNLVGAVNAGLEKDLITIGVDRTKIDAVTSLLKPNEAAIENEYQKIKSLNPDLTNEAAIKEQANKVTFINPETGTINIPDAVNAGLEKDVRALVGNSPELANAVIAKQLTGNARSDLGTISPRQTVIGDNPVSAQLAKIGDINLTKNTTVKDALESPEMQLAGMAIFPTVPEARFTSFKQAGGAVKEVGKDIGNVAKTINADQRGSFGGVTTLEPRTIPKTPSKPVGPEGPGTFPSPKKTPVGPEGPDTFPAPTKPITPPKVEPKPTEPWTEPAPVPKPKTPAQPSPFAPKPEPKPFDPADPSTWTGPDRPGRWNPPEPVKPPVKTPVTIPGVQPVIPIVKPVVEPVVTPIPGVTPMPIINPVPVTVPIQYPVTQPVTQPVVNPVTEPVIEPKPDTKVEPNPVTEPEPETQPEPIPITKPAPAPITTPKPEPVIDPEPIESPIEIPIIKTNPAPKPVDKPAPSPVDSPKPVTDNKPIIDFNPVTKPPIKSNPPVISGPNPPIVPPVINEPNPPPVKDKPKFKIPVPNGKIKDTQSSRGSTRFGKKVLLEKQTQKIPKLNVYMPSNKIVFYGDTLTERTAKTVVKESKMYAGSGVPGKSYRGHAIITRNRIGNI